MLLCHDDLENHYKLNFQLIHHYKYSLTELDNMMPFERDIYVSLLEDYLKQEKMELDRRRF
jgi:hypothetical protein